MSLFGDMFDQTRPGPGVPRNEPKKKGPVRFFTVLGRKLWKLLSLNLFYFIAAIPGYILLYMLLYLACGDLFEPMITAMLSGSAEYTAFYIVKFVIMLSTMVTVMIGIGPCTAGMAHILRNMSREEHAWVLSDFLQYSRENWKQGLVTYLINLMAVWLGGINITFYVLNNQLAPLLVVLVILLIFAMMQPYIYLLMTTFRLNLRQLYKNAFLLTVIRLPQNLLIYVCGMAVVAGVLLLVDYFPQMVILIPILAFTIPWLIFVFHDYSVIKKYMIQEEQGEE